MRKAIVWAVLTVFLLIGSGGVAFSTDMISSGSSGLSLTGADAAASSSYAITTPTPGSTLNSTGVIFQWTSGAAEYWLQVGSSVGGSNYLNSGSLGTSTSTTVTGLPTDGSTIYVRLWYRIVSNGDWAYTDCTYKAAGAYVITSPVPGSVLSSTGVTFQWTSGAAEYWLQIGSDIGSSNYYNSGSLGTSTSATVKGLPSDGSTVYVRFWYRVTSGGTWVYIDYTYAGGCIIVSPVPGSTLSSTTVTFQWTSGAAEYWLQIGSSVGGSDYYNSGSLGTSISVTATGLPGDSRTVYARLWYRVTSGGTWVYTDCVYNGYIMTSPVPDTKLSSTSVTFQWTSGAAEYWLQIGSSVGGNDYYNSGSLGTSASAMATGLPRDGSTIYVRLWYRATATGNWVYNDYTYTATGGYAITSPDPGSALSSSTVTFQWNSGAAEYWAFVGSTVGGYDYYYGSSLGTSTSVTATGLPTNGSIVYVRLWYRITSGGGWSYTDCAYKSSSTYTIISPPPGSALTATQTFQWNSGAAEYWLLAGSSSGVYDYYSSGSLGTSTSTTATNLPVSGMTYVRLYYRVTAGGNWSYGEFIYGGFNEQFNGLAYNWVKDAGNWNVGKYYYTSGVAGNSTVSTYNSSAGNPYINVDYSARLLRTGENSSTNRLVIRASGAIGTDGHFANEYSFQYDRIGNFSVYKRVNGVAGVLQNWTSTSAINKYSQWNTLRVVAVGSNLSFYINGQLVWSGTDSSLTSGKVGVGMYRDTAADNGFYVNWATLSIPSAATSQSLTAAATGYEALPANNPSSGAVDPSDGDIDRSGL